MGLFSKLVGAPDIGETAEKVGGALDKLFTSKDEKLTHQEVLERIKQNPQKWQNDINLAQATHRTLFVAGARPSIMWVCAIGLAFVFILNPIIQWVTGSPGPDLPTEDMTKLVYALLGLGIMRTAEKMHGVAK